MGIKGHGGVIRHDFAGVEELVTRLTGLKGELDGTLDSIRSQVDTLRAGWSDDSSAEYQITQAEWTSAREGLDLVLADVTRAVRDGNDGMSETNRIAKQRFTNMR